MAEKPVYSVGDIIDKLSILTRKIYFGEEDSYEEYKYLVDGLSAHLLDGKLIAEAMKLCQMNFEIWNRENDIRKGGESKFSKEEIADRAIQIRNLNRKRVEYKNNITHHTSSGFNEVKINHLSGSTTK